MPLTPLIDSIIALLILVAFFLILFFVYVAYRMAKPPREVGKWTPEDFELNYEDFTVKADDGIEIRGWHVNKNSDCTIFLLHGYTVSRWTFYIKKMTEFLKDKNYNIVLFDFRAHGESGGKYTTVGDKELLDLKAVLSKFATSKNCVVGYSMGGIIAIRALTLPQITCGIADSPPIHMDLTGKRGLKYFANLPLWIYDISKPFFRLFAHGKMVNIIELADKINKPLLLIGGKKDPLVMESEIREFYDKNKEKNSDVEIWITEAPHVRSVKIAEEAYRKRVMDFIDMRCG